MQKVCDCVSAQRLLSLNVLVVAKPADLRTNSVCLRSRCAFDEYSQVLWLCCICSRDSPYPLFSFHSSWSYNQWLWRPRLLLVYCSIGFICGGFGGVFWFCFVVLFLSRDWQTFPQFPFPVMSSEQQEKTPKAWRPATLPGLSFPSRYTGIWKCQSVNTRNALTV